MPTISIEQRVLEALMAASGHTHDVAALEQELPLLGTDIDRCDDTTLDIEIFPDRPDLLSAETLARAMRAFLHNEAVSPGLEVRPPTTSMSVDDELADVRPVILCAMVHGVNLGEDEHVLSFVARLLQTGAHGGLTAVVLGHIHQPDALGAGRRHRVGHECAVRRLC